jgi:phytanoyl-CoA hydroxylase
MTHLSTAEIERFHAQGFLVVPGVLAESDLTPLRTEYRQALQELVERWGLRGANRAEGPLALDGGQPFETQLLSVASAPGFDLALLAELDITLPHMPFTVMRPDSELHIGPAVLGLLGNRAILDVVEGLLGGEILASPNQHCRLKLPVSGGPEPFGGRRGETIYAPTMWHQDAMTQMPRSDDTEVLTCWVPTDDVEEVHGCLCVVPGAHTAEQLLPWPLDEGTTEGLEARAVPLPVKRGDVVLLHKRVPHGSRVNRSQRVRWSFDFRYYPASQESDRPWFPSIVVRSQANPAAVHRDAEAWRRQWLAARDRLAASSQPVPGRREFAQTVAEALIKRWEAGDHGVPVFDPPGGGTGDVSRGSPPC